jgi:transposase
MSTLKIKQHNSGIYPPYIGFDVSMDVLHTSRRPSEGHTDKQFYSEIPNNAASIRTFVSEQEEQKGAHYVFEATGVYSRRLEYTLSELGVPFSKVNGLQVKGFVHSIGGLKKSDCLDAIHIRQYGEMVELRTTPPLLADKAERQRTTQGLANIEKQLQNMANQLHLLDNEAFEMSALRESYTNIIAVLETEKAKMQDRLGCLDDESAKTGQTLLKTIVGIGDVTAKLLWEATNGFRDFDKAKQAARFLGVVPVDDESGKIRRKRGICQSAYPIVRAKLYVAAGSALQHNPACKELYQRLRARGKSVKVARIAVVHKLVRTAFGVVKSGKPFDPNYDPKKRDEQDT